MAGRRPKPTAMKVLEGNPGKRKLPEGEPEPKGNPRKPDFVTGRAQEIWKQYSRVGYWLTLADSHLLAIWCRLTAELEAAIDPPPASQLAQFRMMAAELGFSPTARPKLSARSEEKDEKPKAEKFFVRSA